VTRKDLETQDENNDFNWSALRGASKISSLRENGLKNNSAMGKWQKHFDWDRLKRSEALKMRLNRKQSNDWDHSK